MATTAGETRKTDTGAEWAPSKSIALLSTPKPADDAAVVVHTPSQLQGPSASISFDQQDANTINISNLQQSSRSFSPLSTAPKPLPATPANAGGGGSGGVGGRSTTNPTGGGSNGGGGGGPGVVNANQFVGVNFGASQGDTPANNNPMPPPQTTTHTDTPASSQGLSLLTDLQTTSSMTAPSLLEAHHHPNPPPHGHGHEHGQGQSSDPLYVLNMNTGETVPANVTHNTFSTWSENLLAQVSGGTVSSYSWDLSQAPDAANISGQNSANLQFSWSSFTGTRTDTISVTETPQSGSPITQTMTFAVAGTDSPAYSATRPTSSSTWPAVITPDQLSSGQATQSAGPYANIGLADGSVQTSFAMPSYNPNTTPVSLDYNSTAANAQPIFLTEYQLPLGQAVPSTLTAQLTFNNTPLATVSYDTSELNPGDIVQIALQANATGLSTGRYPWSITVTNGSTPTTYNGNVDIVNQANSPYGAGWSLDNVQQLVSVSGGMMLVNPGGTSLFFASNGSGGFTTPAGDLSILVQNPDGSFTRTLTDGTQINFNSSGQETSSVDRDGNNTTFGYTSGQLTTITDMNGQVTTLAYNGSGLLSSITDPASRTATLSYTGTQLTSITDPANAVWQYAYDSSNDMTALTDPNNHTTTFTYNFADRVSSFSVAGNTPEQVTAMQMNGLVAPATPPNSATFVTSDTTTEGNWQGVYGSQGYNVIENASSYPSYVQVNASGNTNYIWSSSTTDPRALEDASGSGRIAACWFSNSSFSVNVTDGRTHQLALYLLDWDNKDRSEQVQITDAATGNVLDTQTVSNFANGEYLVWDVSGDIDISITHVSGDNAVLSGLFFDPAPINPVPAVLLAAGAQAQITDANNNAWTTGLDWRGFGQDVADIDPLGDASLNYINANGLVWMASDPLGRRTVDFFDSKGNITEEVAPDDTTQQYQYNSFGEVTQYTDQEGNVTTYAYNSNGDLTQVTDALGYITTFAYNNAGLVTSTTDPNGNVTTNTYNNLNELASTTNAAGGVYTYTYNNAGQRVSSIDPLSNTSTFAYDAMNHLTSKTLPDTPGVFSTYTYTYDNDGNQLTVTDPNGNTTTNAYNAFNNLVSTTNPLNDTTSYGYDNVGNLISVTNPLSQAVTFAYNAANEQISTTDPMGNQTTYAYDAAGEQTSVTDPMGNVTEYTYTPRGEVASKYVYSLTQGIDPLEAVVVYTYGPCGCLSSITIYYAGTVSGTFSGDQSDIQFSGTVSGGETGTFSGYGNGTSGQFTSSGTISNVDNGVTYSSTTGSYTHDFNFPSITGTFTSQNSTNIGLPIGVTGSFSGSVNGYGEASGTFTGTLIGPLSDTIIFVRNADDEITSTTDGQGNTTVYGHDGNGNVTSVTDPNGNTTTATWNPLNQVASVTNALGNTTTMNYNNAGQLTSVVSPAGDPTYTYDGQGRILTETDAMGGVTSYAYDLAGNRVSVTDPDGNVTNYQYNAANEMVSMTNPLGYQSTYAYNAAGWLTSTTDADGRTINYAYNENGQKISETWVGGNYTANYQYNADGELTSASDPNSVYTYTYNVFGQVMSVSNTGTPGVPTVTLNYAYNSFGNRTSLTDSLGGNISYAFNYDNQLTSLGLSVNGTLDAQLTMGYDDAGNLTNITRTAPAVSGDTITTSYVYNQANELTNITDTDSTKSLTLANYTYGYNADGNVSSYQDNSGNSLTYGYNGNQELTSATGTLNSSNYSVSYAYDANGNRTMAGYQTGTGNELLSDGTYTYAYDHNGNTISQTNIATGSVTYYTWDYENRLTEVKEETSTGTVLNDEKFTYDVFGNRIAVSLNGTTQLYTVYDGSNPYMDFNGSGQLAERYLTNPNGLNQFYGQVNASGTTQWFLTDNLGSIRQVVDTSGNVLDAILYDPYGNILSQSNAANAPRFLFAGGSYDPITGTYQDGAREDDPEDGRWLNQDPLGLGPDSNPYRYVGNNPTSATDPSGLINPIKGLSDEEYELVVNFLKGKIAISKIPNRVRQIAANFYQARSATVRNINNARAFNLARARALRTGINPPGNIIQFNKGLRKWLPRIPLPSLPPILPPIPIFFKNIWDMIYCDPRKPSPPA